LEFRDLKIINFKNMSEKKFFQKLIILVIAFSIFLVVANQILAIEQQQQQGQPPTPLNMLEQAKPAGVSTEKNPAEIAATVINIALGFLGIVLLGVILYGGFLWMTAGGNEEQVKKAKAWITNGVIGIIIIIAAYSIAHFVIEQLGTIGQTIETK
jgi:hypothetical protein